MAGRPSLYMNIPLISQCMIAVVPRPATMTTEQMRSLAATGTEALPSHTKMGPPKNEATAVVRENTFTALTAPFRGAT